MKIVYDIHSAANLFPMMDDEAFAALKKDIAENGLRESLVFWKNKLVDGRNRAKACEELGIQPGESELDEDQDPIAYVISANLHRRHLTTSQRAEIAAKLATKGRGGDRKSGKIKGSNDPLKIDDAAKLLNVSPASVKRAKAKGEQKGRVGKPTGKRKNAPDKSSGSDESRDKAARLLGVPGEMIDSACVVLDKGTPELIAAVDHGHLEISHAAKIAELPAEQQAAAMTTLRIGCITNKLTEICTLMDQSACEINEVIPTVSNSVISQWHGLIDEIIRHANATFKSLSEAGQSTTDVDAIRSRFSVVKLDGVWMPAIDGAIFMGVDNAFSTKKAAIESVEYWREKCANDSQEFTRISENAKRYREAASGAYPVIEESENEWYVILPDMTESGAYRTRRDAESRAQSLRNQFAGGADE